MSRPLIVTSSQYLRPRRPVAVRAYNRLRVGAPPALDANNLLATARERTGLDDFGDPFFLEPLSVLVRAIGREANPHALGRLLLGQRLRGMLENRLRLEALYRAAPEVAELPIARPIVIAGLQRTGTTLLHRLLSADPRARALLGWEALHPVPLPGEGRRGSAKRRWLGKLAERGFAELAPEFFAIHPVEASAPEEDILLLDHSFATQTPEATLHVPSYAAWLEAQDLTPAYRHLGRMLRALSWQRSGDFWVLKTPHHMEHLDALLQVFPDAVIVQTHRDPQATMASFCSMVAHGRSVFSDQVQPRAIGRHWLRKVQRMLDRSEQVRAARRGQFVDVYYDDLLSDPLEQVRRIYQSAGLELSEQASDAMRRTLARSPQHRFGKHSYSLWDFGLSPSQVEDAFADYCARRSLPRSAPAKASPRQQTGPSGLGHRTPFRATVTALLDQRHRTTSLAPLDDSQDLSGRTYLITGVTHGLGQALAIDLARRGARIVGTGRNALSQAQEQIARQSDNPAIELHELDLTDLEQVARFVDRLKGLRLDGLVANAGWMPRKPVRSRQGYEGMFAVHYLANHLLVRRLIGQGTLPPRPEGSTQALTRVVFVASEAHRSAPALNLATLGHCVEYDASSAMQVYASSKLALLSFALELVRRSQAHGTPQLGVHAVCPGAVASSIARDVPRLLQPLAHKSMRALFPSPGQAVRPVSCLTAAPELSQETGWYLHLLERKLPSPQALDPAAGAQLWAWGERAIAPWIS